jgi:hypothetical protein
MPADPFAVLAEPTRRRILDRLRTADSVAERLLDGRPVPPIRGEDARQHGWDELHQAYAAELATS